MFIKFWGTRGSIPSPGPRTTKYGGNTSCIELRSDDGTLIILDCGTGVRELGVTLMKARPVRANMFIGHSHWDHIQGFPFFLPAFDPASEITIYAPAGFELSLERAMEGQMQYSYFPVKLQDLSSKVRFVTVDEGVFYVGNVVVETQFLNHTAPTVGYRMTVGGRTVVYATDHEPFWHTGGSILHPGDLRHIEFLKQADLVIHDSQYTEDEYPSKLGWGHSPADYAAQVAIEAGAQQLALTHHDPTHDDTLVQRLEAATQARAAASRSQLEVFAAAEGMEISLTEQDGLPASISAPSALEPRSVVGARVLIATNVPEQATAIASVLLLDGIEPIIVQERVAALDIAHRAQPDLAILDAHLFETDVFMVANELKAHVSTMDITLIMLSDVVTEETIRRAQAAGISDFLRKPFSPPMLHARIRSWLARHFESTSRSRLPIVSSMTGAINHRTASAHGTGSQTDALAGTSQRRREQLTRKATIFKNNALFSAVDDDKLQRLAVNSRLRQFPAGSQVLRQGEPGDSMMIIVSGRVRVVGREPEPRSAEVLLRELGPGEICGEFTMVDGLPRASTVTAITRTRCLIVPRHDFLTMLSEHPALSLRLASMLAGRLRDTDQMLMRDGPDALTGLTTRRGLENQYRREVAVALRRGYALGVLFVDLDHLKHINDTFGHLVGDEALRALADAMRSSMRESDLVARVGGDEFVALLTDIRPNSAELITKRVHTRLSVLSEQRGIPLPLSCSIGIAIGEPPPASLDELVNQADKAMYLEKQKKEDKGEYPSPFKSNAS